MNESLMQKLQASSYLGDGNLAYVEDLYDIYLKNPAELSDYWREHFTAIAADSGVAARDVALSDVREKFLKLAKRKLYAAPTRADRSTQHGQFHNLLAAFRNHGHLCATLDPLELEPRRSVRDLELESVGFTQADLNTELPGFGGAKLGDIYSLLQKTYCGNIGLEFMHIADVEQVAWIADKLEKAGSQPNFTEEHRKRIYQHLVAADGLERYLGSKYVGQKRFSLEGAISLIPMLDELIQRSGEMGVKELVLGMAHRGRLNVLVNILGKSPERLFKEFEGKSRIEGHSGDVKYHMGFSSHIVTPAEPVHLALAFNPSHLEIINPVVEGSVRARQDIRKDTRRDHVIPVVIHGDAALAGQGVVAETFNFSQARGFCTGGTIHIVINNQIGFTTSNPLDARSTLYCTDVAKMVQAPVFHVNGDDADACAYVMQVALEFRMRFKKDVMIDLVCYRKHGHNEADEPSGTQPLMYQKIKSHPTAQEIYVEKLLKEGIFTKEEAYNATEKYREALEKGASVVHLAAADPAKITKLANWADYKNHDWTEALTTNLTMERLKELGQAVTTIPADFALQAQVAREYEMRQKMIEGEMPFNWGFAETLAYATLLTEGYAVRLCGQDSGRGTFSHRHGVLHNYENGSIYVPLSHIDPKQKNIDIIDSVLSEEAVLGFEYGYATTTPSTLVIWEAQFGDFANGAQVVIDQFISSAEQKWQGLCGIVMYLPHGYEGMGPEHSSARLERYLQLCAENNMQVCVPSTPAQMFHMIRRQMLRPYRKPLIVFTPKSLLRHKMAISSLDDLANGQFHVVLPETTKISAKKVRKVVCCAGKVYYDLLQYRFDKNLDDIAILRVEQLYPFPTDALKTELAKYKAAKEIVWCQEEPQNQGAWYALRHHFEECVGAEQALKYAGRVASASPATGYASLHAEQQMALVADAMK